MNPQEQLKIIENITKLDISDEQFAALDDYRTMVTDLMDSPMVGEPDLEGLLDEIGLSRMKILLQFTSEQIDLFHRVAEIYSYPDVQNTRDNFMKILVNLGEVEEDLIKNPNHLIVK